MCRDLGERLTVSVLVLVLNTHQGYSSNGTRFIVEVAGFLE